MIGRNVEKGVIQVIALSHAFEPPVPGVVPMG